MIPSISHTCTWAAMEPSSDPQGTYGVAYSVCRVSFVSNRGLSACTKATILFVNMSTRRG